MTRLTRAGLLALALPLLYGAILLMAPQNGVVAALLAQKPNPIDRPQHFVSVDFNQDGYDDLAIANFEAGTVTILINQKDGTFAPQKNSPSDVGSATVALPSSKPVFLASGDINPEDVDGDRIPNKLDNCPNVYNPANCPASDPVKFPECFLDTPCKTLAETLKPACTISGAQCTVNADCGASGGTCEICRNANAAGQCDNDNNGVGDSCEFLNAACGTIDSDGDGKPDYDPPSTSPSTTDNCPRIPNPFQEPEVAAGLDGICGTADDNAFLYGANGSCPLPPDGILTSVGAACSRSADLVVVNNSSRDFTALGQVRVRANDGAGGLKLRTSQSASYGAIQATLADFNLDHRLDLVVSNSGSDALQLFPGADDGDMGGVCFGGSNAGRSCRGDLQCPSGTCRLDQFLLSAGECRGGSNDRQVCTTTENCTGGGSCRLVAKPGTASTCLGGTNQGHTCTEDSGCPAGICRSPAGPEGVVAADFNNDRRPDLAFVNRIAGNLGILLNDSALICTDGPQAGATCSTDTDCGAGGACRSKSGEALFTPMSNSPFATGDQPVFLLAASALICAGGPQAGATCSTDTDCGAGGTCRAISLDGDQCADLVVLEQGPLNCSSGNCVADRGAIRVFTIAFNPITSLCSTGAPIAHAPIDLGTGHVPRDGVLADFDGDGDLDLVVADFLGGQVLLYKGSGNGQFTPDPPLTGLTSPAALARLNIDSNVGPRVDLAVLGYNNDRVDLYRNTSSSGVLKFDVVTGSPTSPWRNVSAMAMFGADASTGIDLGLLISVPPRLDILSGTGTTFRALPPEPLTGPVRASGMTVADLRQDGLADLLVLDDDPIGKVTPLITDRLGKQTERVTWLVGAGPTQAAVGPLTLHGNDLDNDGVPDKDDNCPNVYNPPGCPEYDPGNFPKCFIDVPCTTLADALKGACTVSGAPCTMDANCGATGGTCDACRHPNAAGQCDNDDDKIGDQCEILNAACGNVDSDQDGVPDYDLSTKKIDNCPSAYNPNQSDVDRDGRGDVCDGDMDNDGVQDRLDNCPTRYNPPGCPANDKIGFPECFVDIPCPTLADKLKGCLHTDLITGQCDNDEDGIGDQCEILDATCANVDTDLDLVPDYDPITKKVDNCPWVPNADQSDSDSTCSISRAACVTDADCGAAGGTCKGNGIGDLCDGSRCDYASDSLCSFGTCVSGGAVCKVNSDCGLFGECKKNSCKADTDCGATEGLCDGGVGTCHQGPRSTAACLTGADCVAPINDAVVVNGTDGNLSFLIGDASGSLRPAPLSWSSIGSLDHPVAAALGLFAYTCTGGAFLTPLTCNANPEPGILVAEKGAPGPGGGALRLYVGNGAGGFSAPAPPADRITLPGDPINLFGAPDQKVCPNPWPHVTNPSFRFDNDGRTDVIAVTLDAPGAPALGIYLPSNEGLKPPPGYTNPLPLPSPPIDAQVVDLNQDGYLDIVALSGGSGFSTTLTIYIGLGNGLFFTDPSLNPTDALDGMTMLASGNVNLSVDSTYPDLVLFDSVNRTPVILLNTLTDRADIDRSGRVDGYDLALLARSFGAERGEDFTLQLLDSEFLTLKQSPDLAKGVCTVSKELCTVDADCGATGGTCTYNVPTRVVVGDSTAISTVTITGVCTVSKATCTVDADCGATGGTCAKTTRINPTICLLRDGQNLPERFAAAGPEECDSSCRPTTKREQTVGACVGGSSPGTTCSADSDCPGGGRCGDFCAGGSSPGMACVQDSDCPGSGTCGTVLYGLPVDINLDGIVDGTDLALIASKFGRKILP